MKNEVDVSDARVRLLGLIDEVEKRGVEVVITRHERPVARLVPVEGAFSLESAKTAARRLREASKGKTLASLSIRELIDEARQ